MSAKGSIKREKIVVIPELEDALKERMAQPGFQRPWTKEEEAILIKYYNHGITKAIWAYLRDNFPPGRTITAIQDKAKRMGLFANRNNTTDHVVREDKL